MQIYQPQDASCNQAAFGRTVKNLPPFPIAWVVVEQGVFNLTGSQFVVGSGRLNRTKSTLVVNKIKIPSQYFNFNFPTNCVGAVGGDCAYPQEITIW